MSMCPGCFNLVMECNCNTIKEKVKIESVELNKINTNTGWSCPICGMVWSPNTTFCGRCSSINNNIVSPEGIITYKE